MPTYSAMQLDRFLEPKATTIAKTRSFSNTEDSFPKLERHKTTSLLPLDDPKFSNSSRRSGELPPPYPQLRRRSSVSSSPQFNSNIVNVIPPITPALYTTPESTPLPVSPTSSFPPSSPYLINHKRRGPRLSKSISELNVAETSNVAEVGHTRSLSEENVILEGSEAVDEVNGDAVEMVMEDENGGGLVKVREGKEKEKEKEKGKSGSTLEREGGESEDFFDPQESMSYSSSNELEDFGGERSAGAITPMGEFYDAWEELSSDSGRRGVRRSLGDVETELREMRLALMMEIEKRKEAEEAVQCMQSQWRTLREKLGTTGVVLPADLGSLKEGGQSDASPTDDICQQIHIARFVSGSIGRGIARAEFEAEMEAQLEVKNFEIARLCDRLHYYETMNREMSQRNQEAFENARRDRQNRRRRQKLVWGSIATAITLGSSALAWSYLPAGNGSSSSKTIEASKPDVMCSNELPGRSRP